jgi:MFS family permease
MKIITRRGFNLIYLLAFLLSLADAVAGYTQSSFLQQYFSLDFVGLIVGLGTVLTIIVSIFFPKIIAKLSLYVVGLIIVFINLGSSLILATTQSTILVVVLFLVRYLGFIFLLITLDVFLENISKDNLTGSIRTKYLSAINLAWLASPILMGYLVGNNNNYSRVYWFGTTIICLFLFIFILNKKQLLAKPIKYQVPKIDFGQTLKKIISNKDFLAVFCSVIALNVFYVIAVLYVPLYLNETIGLSWQTLGIIFTIMLLPFVLIQMPAGWLADKFIGEKEMMMAGNVIMAGAGVAMWLTTSTSFIFWAAILFLSRIGAALAEAMQEVYFYKKVNASDLGLINFFRQARNVGWLIGSLIAFVALNFLNIPQLFLIVSAILILNTLQLIDLKDTK